MNRRNNSGFTLVEIAVSLAAFGLIMLFTFNMMTSMSRSTTKNNQLARAQADARIALDMMESDVRAAGAEIDYASGQRQFVYADPYSLAFNSNLFPAVDDGTGFPQAINPGAGGAGVPSDAAAIYLPNTIFATGAETVFLSIDSNRDGVVDGGDKGDDDEEDSANPNDYVLYRGIFGWNGNENEADLRPLALVRGPEANSGGVRPAPLFSYWIDHDDDRSTDPRLHGDADGNGDLSQAEIGGLTPVVGSNLARIERVRMTVTTETAFPAGDPHVNDGYLRHELRSEVQMRQRPSTTAVVYGFVFSDLDADGVQDPSEAPIPDVLIRSSLGHQTKTRGDGSYRLDLPPGEQTITEIDPTGYLSTTPNEAIVDLYPGDYLELAFGDNIGSGTGIVTGRVYVDLDQNGAPGPEEIGLGDVKIFSDGGEYTYTDDAGYYSLTVPLGSRTISEFDPEGYLSTTANAVDVVLDTPGQTLTVNFGDADAAESGTIQGWVFLDEDRDGARDANEGGVLGATIIIEGQSMQTDGQGFFSMTVAVGNHKVDELDPPGYTSTTPNRINGVQVAVDQTVSVYFGDIVEEDVNFDIIELSETERALSIGSGDLGEDNRGDVDLFLGTRFAGGTNNLLVWENQRRNQNTPNGAIFASTPNYTRANLADVTALAVGDLNGDGKEDLVSGLSATASPLLNIWLSNGGALNNSPDQLLPTDGGRGIMDLEIADMDNDGDADIVAGLTDADLLGHIEIWWNSGNGVFSDAQRFTHRANAWSMLGSLGEVSALAVADINHDGWRDIVAGAVDGSNSSSINVYLRIPYVSVELLKPRQAFDVYGSITTLALLDMVEDNSGDLDLLIASQHGMNDGGIEQWNMADDFYFGLLNESGRVMDDWMQTRGAPLSLVTGQVDNDVFPDLIVGTRTSESNYTGNVELARTFGHLPAEARLLNADPIGVVMTMTGNDFNLDNVLDFSIGTQEASDRGRVYVFYRQ
jgi:prepilin-type N-terminal cleavage/methylation domain-containing protein